MNINLEHYKVFYVVAKKGNITAASKELMISQPAISKSIKLLEDELNGTLFIRSKKGVTLTSEGELFYNYISKAMEYIEEAENKFIELTTLDAGTIKIGISTTLTKVFLLPYLEEFKNKYPKINIQILTSSTKVLFEKLKEGLLDIVIYNSPCDYDYEFPNFKIKKIHDSFFVGKKYKDLTKDTLHLKDLNNYPLILQHQDSNMRKFLDTFCLKNNVVLKESVNASSFSLATEFTRINYGISFLTKEYIKDYINKDLFELKIKEEIPVRYISLAYRSKETLNFCSKKFIDILKEKSNKD